MNSYLKKVKIYVVIFAIVIVIASKFIATGLRNNVYFTPDYASRTLAARRIQNEYAALGISKADSSATSTPFSMTGVDFEKSIPVLVYHGILKHKNVEEPADISENEGIDVETFKQQLFALKKAGYSTITTDELLGYMEQGHPFPFKPILITFDDGRTDSFKYADPILNALDFKATMFVIGKFGLAKWDQRYYLSAKEIKEMQKSGRWDIQAHSHDGHNSYLTAPRVKNGHFFSHKFWLPEKNRLETDEEFSKRVSTDLKSIQSELQELLQKPIRSFAYPFGDFGQNNTNFARAREINVSAGGEVYRMLFFQNDPNYRYTQNYYIPEKSESRPFLIKRIIVQQNWTGADLLGVLKNGTAKTFPFADTFETHAGWRVYWGALSSEVGKLHLEAEADETGGTVILDGTRAWKNYSVRSRVSSMNGSSVFIWVRYQDDLNNAACNFGNGFIHIEQIVHGTKRVIKGEIDRSIILPRGEFTVEAQVKDRTLRCILNGKQVVETQFLDESIAEGGIGFKTWSEIPGVAGLDVYSVTADEL